MNQVVYLADSRSPDFASARQAVDVVCTGDSLTGWNNFGPVSSWPFPTYPQFLQEMCAPLGLTLADGGIAGEVSDQGLSHIERYLQLFPSSRRFIIGFGTNDLGSETDRVVISSRVLGNLRAMVDTVREAGKQPVLFNVPYLNEAVFSSTLAKEFHEQRDYHNGRLAEYCTDNDVPLADICSRLASEYFGDEVHPNEKGAKVIAECVFETLEKTL